jgi:CubicO group peptidase (beta-lactamase class C family)
LNILTRMMFGLVLLMSVGAAVQAAAPKPAEPLTAEAASQWLDEFWSREFKAAKSVGIVTVIFNKDGVLAAKGYGFADRDKRAAVDPAKTMFRPGSISKLFMATSVMQLVEQGKLDLDADINRYLDFKVSGKGGAKITMRHLLRHEAGFEESYSGTVRASERVLPLSRYVREHLPRRVYRPGFVAGYSNFGSSLAGYIVERVSGEPYAFYVQAHILNPLGMAYSTANQPVPKRLIPSLTQGYLSTDGAPQPYELINDAPAGVLSVSGIDLARFGMAHLNKGVLGEARILQTETAEQMQDAEPRAFPLLDASMLGFYESNINGRRVTGHDGGMAHGGAQLKLFMNEGVGYLIINNTGDLGATFGVYEKAFAAFAARFFPGNPSEGSVSADVAARDARLVEGRYSDTRGAEENILTFGKLFQQILISRLPDNSLIVTGGFGEPIYYRQIAPLIWKEKESGRLLAAKLENGKVSYLTGGSFAYMLPLPWWQSNAILLPALLLSLLIFIGALLQWPIRRLALWKSDDPGIRRQRRHLGLAGLTGVSLFLVWLWFAATMVEILPMPMAPYTFGAILLIANFILVGRLVVFAISMLKSVLSTSSHWKRRIAYLTFVLAVVAVTWFAVAFKLLQFNPRF